MLQGKPSIAFLQAFAIDPNGANHFRLLYDRLGILVEKVSSISLSDNGTKVSDIF